MLYYHQGNGVGKSIAQATAREILRKLGLELAMVDNRTNVRRGRAKNFTTPLEKKQDLTLQIHTIYIVFLKPFADRTNVRSITVEHCSVALFFFLSNENL